MSTERANGCRSLRTATFVAVLASTLLTATFAHADPSKPRAAAPPRSTSGSPGPYRFSDTAAVGGGASCYIAGGATTAVSVVPPLVKPRPQWRSKWQGQYVDWTVVVQYEVGSKWLTAVTRHDPPTYAPFGTWTTFAGLKHIGGLAQSASGTAAFRVVEKLAWVRPTATTVSHPRIDGRASTTIRNYHYPYATAPARSSCQDTPPVAAQAPTLTVPLGLSTSTVVPMSDPDGDRPLSVQVLSATQASAAVQGFATGDGRDIDIDASSAQLGPATVTYEVVDPGGAVSKPATLAVQVVRNPSAIVVDGSPNPGVTDQSVTLTATVASADAMTATPTGTVDFTANGVAIPNCTGEPVSPVIDSPNSFADCVVSDGFDAGSYSIVATYSGDGTYAGADNSASPLTEVVSD